MCEVGEPTLASAAAEPAAARKYYEGAARVGDPGAALRLGLMLAEGRGGEADPAATPPRQRAPPPGRRGFKKKKRVGVIIHMRI